MSTITDQSGISRTTSGQCSAASCCGNWTTVDMARQYRAVAGKQHAQVRTHHGKLRHLRWNPSGRHLADLLAGGREIAQAAQAHGFRAQAWDTIVDKARLNLCQSAVRARCKHDVELGFFLKLFASHSQVERLSCEHSVLHCPCFPLVQNDKMPAPLVQPSASLLWQVPTCQDFLQSQRYSEVHLELCQFGHKMRRLNRVLLANVDPCDAEKLRRTCRGVNFVCSRSSTAHRKTSDVIPSRLPSD